jgi:hypothetical protein
MAARFASLRERSPITYVNFLIETRSPPGLASSYPRHFTFYVARPARSILTSYLVHAR